MSLEALYEAAALSPSDINEHIPVLASYASRCATVLELGVRSCVSSWGFLRGLKDNDQSHKLLLAVDLDRHPNVDHVARVASENGIHYAFTQGNDLSLETDPVDLTFIDTWHVYGQLRRELAKFAPLTRKYIIMHDTEVDAQLGESLRCQWDTASQAQETGIPEHEICLGLRPAIEEFLAHNPEWEMEAELKNNNGLTILSRKRGWAGHKK